MYAIYYVIGICIFSVDEKIDHSVLPHTKCCEIKILFLNIPNGFILVVYTYISDSKPNS